MKKTYKDFIVEKRSLLRAAGIGFVKKGLPAAYAGTIFGFAPQHLNVHIGAAAVLNGLKQADWIDALPKVPSWPNVETQLVAGPAIGGAAMLGAGAYGAAKEVYLAKSQNRQEELPRGTKVYVKKRGKLITGVVDRHNHQKGWTRIVADHDKKEYKFASRHLMTV
jgi:hypothetical protein